jgi:hypothetical protein
MWGKKPNIANTYSRRKQVSVLQRGEFRLVDLKGSTMAVGAISAPQVLREMASHERGAKLVVVSWAVSHAALASMRETIAEFELQPRVAAFDRSVLNRSDLREALEQTFPVVRWPRIHAKIIVCGGLVAMGSMNWTVPKGIEHVEVWRDERHAESLSRWVEQLPNQLTRRLNGQR